MSTAREYILGEIQTMDNIILKELCYAPMTNLDFLTAPGSADKHHYYAGGLVAHTAEVLKYALAMRDTFNTGNRNILITAAIWHDYDKIKEYKITSDNISKTDYRKYVRHVAGSTMSLTKQPRWSQVPEETQIAILHAMLAHHGRPEWGSSVEPQTSEAHMLHFADMLSACYGPAKHPSTENV